MATFPGETAHSQGKILPRQVAKHIPVRPPDVLGDTPPIVVNSDDETLQDEVTYWHSLPTVFGSYLHYLILRRLRKIEPDATAFTTFKNSFIHRVDQLVRQQDWEDEERPDEAVSHGQISAEFALKRIDRSVQKVELAVLEEVVRKVPHLRQQFRSKLAGDPAADHYKQHDEVLRQVSQQMVWIESVRALSHHSAIEVYEVLISQQSQLAGLGIRTPSQLFALLKNMIADSNFSLLIDQKQMPAKALFERGQSVFETIRKTDGAEQIREQVALLNKTDFAALLFVLARMYNHFVVISKPRERTLTNPSEKSRARIEKILGKWPEEFSWEEYAQLVKTRSSTVMKAAAIADGVCFVPTISEGRATQLLEEVRPILKKYLTNTPSLDRHEVELLRELIGFILDGEVAVSVIEIKTHLISPPPVQSVNESSRSSRHLLPLSLSSEYRRDIAHTLFALFWTFSLLVRDPRLETPADSDNLTDAEKKIQLLALASEQLMSSDYRVRRQGWVQIRSLFNPLIESGAMSAFLVGFHAPWIDRFRSVDASMGDEHYAARELFVDESDVVGSDAIVAVYDAMTDPPMLSELNARRGPMVSEALMDVFKGKPSSMRRQEQETEQVQRCIDFATETLLYLTNPSDRTWDELLEKLNTLAIPELRRRKLQTSFMRTCYETASQFPEALKKRAVIEVIASALPNRRTKKVYAEAMDQIMQHQRMRIVGS